MDTHNSAGNHDHHLNHSGSGNPLPWIPMSLGLSAIAIMLVIIYWACKSCRKSTKERSTWEMYNKIWRDARNRKYAAANNMHAQAHHEHHARRTTIGAHDMASSPQPTIQPPFYYNVSNKPPPSYDEI